MVQNTDDKKNVRTALVTGGSRGIGREICLALAQEGVQVITCYAHDATGAQETAAACTAYGTQAFALQADVSQEEDVRHLFAQIRELTDRLDILVNNAGITRDGLLLKMRQEQFSEVLDTNLKGAFYCIREASGMMLRQRYGRILSISSVVGVHGNAGQANYAASKSGLIGLSKSAAKELGSRGITVNVVAPGFVETDMTAGLSAESKEAYSRQIPLQRLGQAREIAQAAAFLTSDRASYITGQVLSVDGGMGM